MLRLLPIFIGLLAFPAHSWASSPDLFGFGARAIGTGGAVVSQPQGFEAVYHNPAGLAFEKRPGVAIGYTFGQARLNHDKSDLDNANITSTLIGFDLPLPFGGPLKQRVALGGGFVIPTNTVLRADLPKPGTPDFPVLGNRSQTVTLQAALAVRVTETLSIGAGFMALSSLDGRIEVGPNDEGRIGSSARDQLVAAYAPTAGILLHLPAKTSFGLVFRGASAATFELPLSADLGDGFSVPIPELAIRGVAQYDPAQIEAETSWNWGPSRIALALNWNQWSDFPQPIVYAAAPEAYPALPAPNFTDTLQWAVAIEHEVTRQLHVRGGYRYLPSPVPTQQTVHTHLGSNRHLIALGTQISWSKLYLGLGAQIHLLETTTLNRMDQGATEHGGKIWVGTAELGVTL